MKTKVLLTGPLLSRSGYGEMARFALRALRTREDKYEIYLHTTNWGKTGWLWEDNEEREYIDSRLKETIIYQQNGGTFDTSIQTTIPNEWKKLAPTNIGYTAGIETTDITPEWINATNSMVDRVITISKHSADVFKSTKYDAKKDGENVHVLSCEKPVSYVGFPVKNVNSKGTTLDIDLNHDFNFLCVAQAGPRKNVEMLMKCFLEEFQNDNVGLILKVSSANNCTMDFHATKARIKGVLDTLPETANKKCSFYLLHGNMTDKEMNTLYNHKKVKCFATLTHGEGFGLPLFEAAYNGLPVLATGWSGHLDFLQKSNKNLFASVKYDIAQIDSRAAWPGVLHEQSGWAYPNPEHAKRMMRDVYTNYKKWKTKATTLKKHVTKTFTEETLYNKFCDIVEDVTPTVSKTGALSL